MDNLLNTTKFIFNTLGLRLNDDYSFDYFDGDKYIKFNKDIKLLKEEIDDLLKYLGKYNIKVDKNQLSLTNIKNTNLELMKKINDILGKQGDHNTLIELLKNLFKLEFHVVVRAKIKLEAEYNQDIRPLYNKLITNMNNKIKGLTDGIKEIYSQEGGANKIKDYGKYMKYKIKYYKLKGGVNKDEVDTFDKLTNWFDNFKIEDNAEQKKEEEKKKKLIDVNVVFKGEKLQKIITKINEVKEKLKEIDKEINDNIVNLEDGEFKNSVSELYKELLFLQAKILSGIDFEVEISEGPSNDPNDIQKLKELIDSLKKKIASLNDFLINN
jgi:hypothetical protein